MSTFKPGNILINVGVVGFGYWGPNLARNFFENANYSLTHIADLSESRLNDAKLTYPEAVVTSNLEQLFADRDLSLIAIATPATTHFEIAKNALEHGKHILVEKPLTTNVEEAELLVNLAKEKHLNIFVDHTFLFSNPVRYIKKLIEQKALGDIRFITSQRINLGLIQSDTSVIWDLAIHDLSVIKYWLGTDPIQINSTNLVHEPSEFASTSFISMKYPKNIGVNLTVSWLSPVKLRQIAIVGSKKTVIFDDTNVKEKIKIYDSEINFTKIDKKLMIEYSYGEVTSPFLDNKEALKTEVDEIFESLKNGSVFLSSGQFAVELLKTLTRISNQEFK